MPPSSITHCSAANSCSILPYAAERAGACGAVVIAGSAPSGTGTRQHGARLEVGHPLEVREARLDLVLGELLQPLAAERLDREGRHDRPVDRRAAQHAVVQ